MKKDYSNIIKLLKEAQKAASPGDDSFMPIPGRGRKDNGTVSATPPRPSGQPTANRSNVPFTSNASVKKMQQAIIEVGNAASSSDLGSMQGDSTGQQNDGQGNFIDGSNPFGDFIVNNFVDTKGKPTTFTNVDVAGDTARQNASIQDGRLKGIINSIKRVGTPGQKGGEQSTDGVWKGRTQSALTNIYLLASGFMEFAVAVNAKIGSYTSAELAKFKNLIDTGYPHLKGAAQTNELAEKITQHLVALQSFFAGFNKQVLNNPRMKNQINQTKSFSQYKKAPVDMDPPQGVDAFTYIDIGRPGLKRQLNLNDLKSLKNFKEWMIENDAKATDDNTVKASLELVKIQLGVT